MPNKKVINSNCILNTNVGDLIMQLEFLYYEVNNVSPYKSKYKEFLNIKSLEHATYFFCKEIEQAGTPENNKRIIYAKNALKEFGGI